MSLNLFRSKRTILTKSQTKDAMSGCEQKLKVYDLLDGSLSAAEAAAFRSHLASCSECRAFYEAEQRRAVRLHAALAAPIPALSAARAPVTAARPVRHVPFFRSVSRLAALLALLLGLAVFAAVTVAVILASSSRTGSSQPSTGGSPSESSSAGSSTESDAKATANHMQGLQGGESRRISTSQLATSHQPQATSHQLPATSHQPPATSHQLQATSQLATSQLAPAETNIWTCSDTNGHASTGANWSLGTPTANQAVLLSTNSCADIYWDWDAPATVAAWIQTPGYTGTVTFATQYPHVSGATFTNFTVTGDVDLQGGKWTHPISLSLATNITAFGLQSLEQYRLRVTVVGSMAIGPAAAVDVAGRGFRNSKDETIPAHGGCLLGRSAVPCYGSAKRPEDVGYASTRAGSDNEWKRVAGGGAVYLTVGGVLSVDGRLSANGGIGLSAAAGGSILVEASSITGSGSITVLGLAGDKGDAGYGGAGGRIALWTTTPMTLGTPVVSASVTDQKSEVGGCGTVYLHDSTMKYGVLIIDNLLNRSVARTNAVTSVTTDGDWTFDAIRLGGIATLDVPIGTRLSLPDGFRSVTSTNTSCVSAFVYRGGELDLGPSGEQPLTGGWSFRTAADYQLKAAIRLPTAYQLAWIDLGGHSLTVDALIFGNNAKIRPGTYSASGLDADCHVVDSVGDGTLTVKGRGFYIIVL